MCSSCVNHSGIGYLLHRPYKYLLLYYIVFTQVRSAGQLLGVAPPWRWTRRGLRISRRKKLCYPGSDKCTFREMIKKLDKGNMEDKTLLPVWKSKIENMKNMKMLAL